MKRLVLLLAIAASIAFAQRTPKIVAFALGSDGAPNARAEGSVSAAEDFQDIIADAHENIEVDSRFCDVDDEDATPFTVAASETFGASDSTDLLYGFVAGAWSETPDAAYPTMANERNVEIPAEYIARHVSYAPNRLGVYLIVSPMNNAFPLDLFPEPTEPADPGRYVLYVVNQVGTPYEDAVERAFESFETTMVKHKDDAFLDFLNPLVSALRAKNLDVSAIKLN
jgi:hypothetical protein